MAFSPPNNTAEAHELLVYAQRQRVAARDLEASGLPEASMRLIEAEAAEKEAMAFLTPSEPSPTGTGGELLPIGEHARSLPGLVDTVKNPNVVTQAASRQRIQLAEAAGAFDLAFDMAETINAKNSIEKSLAHQAAVAHAHALKILAEADRQRFPKDKVSLINAATRLMKASQEAISTINKLRGGGQQKMTVVHQHVQVAGGQVAVTGSVERKVEDDRN